MSFKFLAPLFKNGNSKRGHYRDIYEEDSSLLTGWYRTCRYLNQEKDSKIKCWETSEDTARIDEILGHGCLNVLYVPVRDECLLSCSATCIFMSKLPYENVSDACYEPAQTSQRYTEWLQNAVLSGYICPAKETRMSCQECP